MNHWKNFSFRLEISSRWKPSVSILEVKMTTERIKTDIQVEHFSFNVGQKNRYRGNFKKQKRQVRQRWTGGKNKMLSKLLKTVLMLSFAKQSPWKQRNRELQPDVREEEPAETSKVRTRIFTCSSELIGGGYTVWERLSERGSIPVQAQATVYFT